MELAELEFEYFGNYFTIPFYKNDDENKTFNKKIYPKIKSITCQLANQKIYIIKKVAVFDPVMIDLCVYCDSVQVAVYPIIIDHMFNIK